MYQGTSSSCKCQIIECSSCSNFTCCISNGSSFYCQKWSFCNCWFDKIGWYEPIGTFVQQCNKSTCSKSITFSRSGYQNVNTMYANLVSTGSMKTKLKTKLPRIFQLDLFVWPTSNCGLRNSKPAGIFVKYLAIAPIIIIVMIFSSRATI